MELFIVAIVVGVAAFFVAKRFYTMFRKTESEGCACGCTSCPVQSDACGIHEAVKKPMDGSKA